MNLVDNLISYLFISTDNIPLKLNCGSFLSTLYWPLLQTVDTLRTLYVAMIAVNKVKLLNNLQ